MLSLATPRTIMRLLSTLKSLFHSHSQRPHRPMPAMRSPQPYLERYIPLEDLRESFGGRMPLQLVKLVARDILTALRENEKRGIIHGDINQNSIVMSTRDLNWLLARFRDDDSDSEGVDDSFSTGSFEEQFPTVFRLGIVDAHPRISLSVRSPEAILEAPCGVSSDLWSLACVIYLLLTGELLFDPGFQCADLGLTPDESHIIQMIEMLGDFPEDLVRRGTESKKWFHPDGTPILQTYKSCCGLS
ncbi:kinase-like domain-containing protein [Mucidula mucida]|nr:kinase-like domain-containing protein [Mucidula mucida]